MGAHQNQPLVTAGTDPGEATAGGVLVHGRGATARSILQLGQQVHTEGMAYLAPQAANNAWYPNSFMDEIDTNQPWLDSALAAVEGAVETLVDAGIPVDRIMLLGFSQGACLSTEFVARNSRRYGGVVALSGGLIGPEGTEFDYDGPLDGTPAFFGCSDRDPHIPQSRVDESARVYEELGATVQKRIYEGMGHTVNDDELDYIRSLVADLAERD